MTSNGVSNVLNSMTLAKGQEIGNASQTGQGFDILLSSKTAAGTGYKMPAEDSLKQSKGAEESLRSYEKEAADAGSRREISRIDSGCEAGRMLKEAEEPYEELEEKVTKLLAEKLGMTEEEIQKAMEAMGITFESLLLGNGLTDFVGQLTGVQDVTELLFKDNVQELMRQLEGLVTDFTEQTGVTSQELQTILEQLEMDRQESLTGQLEESGQQTELTQQPIEAEKPAEHVSENAVTQQPTEEVQDAVNPEETVATADDKPVEVAEQSEARAGNQNGNQEAENDTQAFSQKNLQSEEPGISRKTTVQNESVQHMTYHNVQQTATDVVEEQIVQTLEQSFVDAEDIMHQITEFTRVTVEQAESSIEMQLNPAHLGKIYLQVVSKEGIITAQLAAQNEAVKEALESQAAVLKENMNQQGLKVEAVEVTIASHEFEQNLENDRQQTGQENGEEQRQKSQRFLSVEQLDELAGTMSEEESLLAKIMLENGNSMDMTV